MNAASIINPWAMLEGMINKVYNQVGNPRCMIKSATPPRTKSRLPVTNSHLKRFVHVIKKPVANPMTDATMVGMMSRRPEMVTLSSKTARKYKGRLKVIALTQIAPMVLESMRPAHGFRLTRSTGIIGSFTFVR